MSRAAATRKPKPPRVTTITTKQTYLRSIDDETEAVRFTTTENGKVKAQRVYTYQGSGEQDSITDWSECDDAIFIFEPEDLKAAVQAVTDA